MLHSGALYVPGKFSNSDVSWFLDTGADVTLISSCVPGVNALQKQSSVRLPITIDGSPLALEGTMTCDIEIAGVEIKNPNIFIVKKHVPTVHSRHKFFTAVRKYNNY